MLTPSECMQMERDTADAYSFDRYGQDAWLQSIRELSWTLGYDPVQVEWILRSKYMRWAADSFVQRLADDEVERFTGKEIVMYHNKWGIEIEEE